LKKVATIQKFFFKFIFWHLFRISALRLYLTGSGESRDFNLQKNLLIRQFNRIRLPALRPGQSHFRFPFRITLAILNEVKDDSKDGARKSIAKAKIL